VPAATSASFGIMVLAFRVFNFEHNLGRMTVQDSYFLWCAYSSSSSANMAMNILEALPSDLAAPGL
jgi:hypothetical protein